MTETIRNEIVITSLKQLRLTRIARDCEPLAREAEQRGLGYLGYLQALLESELAQRHEQQLRQRLKAAAFPYQKRLEDFNFSLIPSVPKVRLLELAQGAFLASMRMCSSLVPAGLEKPICSWAWAGRSAWLAIGCCFGQRSRWPPNWKSRTKKCGCHDCWLSIAVLT